MTRFLEGTAMRYSTALGTLGFLAALASSAPAAGAEDAAKVNGVPIPQSRIDLIAKEQAAKGQPDTPELRNRIKEELITREIVAQEAVKRGLDKTAEVKVQMDFARQSILANAFARDYLQRNPVSEEAMKKEYERVRTDMGDKEFHARHILVKTEEEAKQIIGDIRKGGNFEKIAAEKSHDSSKAKGGDLGWSGPERYVPPFAAALRKLKKGQMTEAPVQTQFGWHVIRVEDERARKFPSFEEAKQQIQQQMQQQEVAKAVSALRAKAKIE
jgi:peptidyl-prolyl cis-trans isomerase C